MSLASKAAAAGLSALAAVAARDLMQREHTLLRNFPVLGHARYLLESVGPELRQYLVAGNNEERPFTRDQRRWVYASAKKDNNYFGFGTDNDLEYTAGYPVIKHRTFGRAVPPTYEDVAGDDPFPTRFDRNQWIRRKLGTKGYVSHMGTLLGSALFRDFVAVHMTWGAVNELGTLTGYHRIVAKTEHGRVVAYRCRICGRVPELLALATERLRATGRQLTPEERELYLP